jgi:hypothetical protein
MRQPGQLLILKLSAISLGLSCSILSLTAYGQAPVTNESEKMEPAPEVKSPAPQLRLNKNRPAIDDRTQYFWQPEGGETAIREAVDQTISKTELHDPNDVKLSNSQSTLNSLATDLVFGLDDNWALSLPMPRYASSSTNTTTAATDVQTSTSSKGLEDPALTLLGTYNRGRWHFHLGGTFSLTLDPAKAATATNIGNRSSGGPIVQPYLGVSLLLTSHMRLGAKLSYQYLGERAIDNQNGHSSVWDGGDSSTANLFYEVRGRSLYIIPVYSISWVDSQTESLNGVATHNTAIVTQTGALDAGYYLSANHLLTASYSVTEIPQQTQTGGNTTQSYDKTEIDFAYRYEF